MPDISYNRKPFIAKDHPQVYKNYLVEAILLLAAIILLLNFLVLPKKRSVADAKVQLTALIEENNSIEQKTAELNNLIAQMKSSKSDVAVLDSALPLNSRITTVHLMFDNIISSSGLTLAGISADANSDVIAAGDTELTKNLFGPKRQLMPVSVNLGLTGTMDQFLSFLKSLEKSARIIDVKSLEVTGAKNNLVNFKLTLKTYFYGPVSASEQTAEALPVE